MTAVNNFPSLEGAIHNPANPHHLMVIKPVGHRVRIYAGDVLIADSLNSVHVIEMNKMVYDPVIYIPAGDLTAKLDPFEKTTYCPLKGEASYFALNGEEIAWSYEAPFDFAAQLKSFFAFWPHKVNFEIWE